MGWCSDGAAQSSNLAPFDASPPSLPGLCVQGYGSDLRQIALKLAAEPKRCGTRARVVVFTQGADSTIVASNGTVTEYPVDKLAPELLVDTNGEHSRGQRERKENGRTERGRGSRDIHHHPAPHQASGAPLLLICVIRG